MKMRLVILISAIAALSSCGTAAQYASSGQKYQDGIYYRPEQSLDKTERVPDETVENLIARSEETSLLLFGDRKDTVIIPDSKSAVIHLDGEEGTTITITDDPFTDIYYSTYPWTYYSPAYVSVWGSPWYYRSWVHYYDPWYWGSWYYDPWFWGVTGVFWDPWFCNPWFWGAPHLPYNPYWDHGHHHHPGPGHISGAWNGHYYGHRTSGSSSVRQYVSRGNSGQTTVSGGRSTVRRGTSGIRGTSSSASSSSGYRRSSSAASTASSSASAVRRSATVASSQAKTYTSGISSVRRSTAAKVSGNIADGGNRQSSALSAFRRNGSYMSSGTTAVKSSVSSYRRPASRVSSQSYMGNGSYGTSSAQTARRSSAYDAGSRFGNSSTSVSRGTSVNRSSSSFSRSSSSFSRSSSSFSRSSSGFSGGSSRGGSGGGNSHRR